jgi:hypothetical protein
MTKSLALVFGVAAYVLFLGTLLMQSGPLATSASLSRSMAPQLLLAQVVPCTFGTAIGVCAAASGIARLEFNQQFTRSLVRPSSAQPLWWPAILGC